MVIHLHSLPFTSRMQLSLEESVTYLPVESIAHLNGDEHGQGHGHRVGRLEHVAVQAVEIWVVWGALEKVALRRGRQGGEGGAKS